MNDNNIYKEEMKRFLDEVKLKEHWLYALMHCAPKASVRMLCEDFANDKFEEMSVADFERRYDEFDPKYNLFVLCFYLYDFKHEAELPDYEEDDEAPALELLGPEDLATDEIIESLPQIIAHICRQSMMEGRPLTMDEAAVAEYGFTPADIKRLRTQINRTNEKLMKKFKKDYEWLKRIVERGIE